MPQVQLANLVAGSHYLTQAANDSVSHTARQSPWFSC